MNVPALSSYVRRKDMDSVLNCIVSDNLAPGEYVERLTRPCARSSASTIA